MKRAPIERTVAEMPLADRPPVVTPLLPDVQTPEYVPVGSVGAEIRTLREQLGQAHARVRELEAANAQLAGMIERARVALGERGGK